jgi:hypothetical protein
MKERRSRMSGRNDVVERMVMGAIFAIIVLVTVFVFMSFAPYKTVDTSIPSRSRDAIDPMEVALATAYADTGVPVEHLRGVVTWECGNDLSRDVKNRNGTIDHGPGLNSRWLKEFAWRFNDGKKIDPHSYSSIKVVARILANNHKVLHDWDWTISSYRWGVRGTIMHGVDRYYIDNVKRLGIKE